MRLSHFEALRPVCPVCRSLDAAESPLSVHSTSEHDAEHIVQGLIRCPRCTRNYPIIDGIPVLVANLPDWSRENLDAVVERSDLAASTVALLTEGIGPGTLFDTRRSHLSSYGWGHWGDLDPEPPPAAGRPAGLLNALSAGLTDVPAPGPGVLVDSGCSVGRSSFELARRYPDHLVVGVDLSFSFLRVAARALRTGRARYPVRRTGIVYEERDLPIDTTGSERVDFWCADALAFPFPAGAAALVTSLNLIDCVPSPGAHLQAIAQVLAPGGHAVIATPWDWSPNATDMNEWIGGHAQLGPLNGSPDLAMQALVGDHPFAIEGLTALGAARDTEWWVRLHDRSTATYTVSVTTLRRS